MKGTQDLLKKIEHFTKENFARWIGQRTHGIDSMTRISTFRDPNPQHALVGGYNALPDKTKFCAGLIDSLVCSLKKCRDESSPNELLALWRHLEVLWRIDKQDIPSGAKKLCNECYHLVFAGNSSKIPLGMQRITLSLAFKIGDSVPDSDLINFLEKKELAGTAFWILVRKKGIQAVGDYFAQYVKLLKPVYVRLTIKNLKKRFEVALLQKQVDVAIQQMSAESQKFVKSEMEK